MSLLVEHITLLEISCTGSNVNFERCMLNLLQTKTSSVYVHGKKIIKIAMDLKKWNGSWMSRYIVSKYSLDMIVSFDRLNSSICVIRAKLTNKGR